MNACTIIAKNYLAHARVLAESFYEHHPDGRFTVLLLDEVDGEFDPAQERFETILPSEIDLPEFEQMAGAYQVLELSTAVKPWLLRRLLRDRDHIVYLDPDIRIYAPCDELVTLAVEHGIVLTPHNVAAMPRDGKKPSETDILIAGAYNLGFIALGHTDDTLAFLDWWGERLLTDCIVDTERGYFVDQRWIDLVPGMVPSVALLRDPAYNVAYWNLHSRPVVSGPAGYTVCGEPLHFFHFSGYDPLAPHLLSKHQNRIELAELPTVRELCDDYGAQLIEHGYEKTIEWPYTYTHMANGLELTRVVRRVYADGLREGALTGSLFDEQGAAAFVEYAKSPAPAAGEPRITRFGKTVYDERKDVQKAFPTFAGADLENLLRWFAEDAPLSMGTDLARLSGVEPDHIVPPVLAPRNAFELGVNLVGYFAAELGVGEAGRQIARALDTQEIPLIPIGLIADGSRQEHAFGQQREMHASFPINLLCVNADQTPNVAKMAGAEFFRDRHTIGWWWWEVSEFPTQWLEALDHVDELWAGSRFVADTLATISAKPVIHIPMPVSVPAVVSADRPGLELPEDAFIFLVVFDHNSVFARKNPLGAIEAFIEAFPEPRDDVCLVIKSINHERHRNEQAQLRYAAANRDDVILIDHYLSAELKNALIASCDVYVSLHRSEGFGISLAEAMLLGKPVIATDYSGTTDFVRGDTAYPVGYKLEAIGPGNAPYPPRGRWAEPDIKHAAHHMRAIFDDPSSARARGRLGAAFVAEHHSPRVAGEAMAARLEHLVRERNLLRPTPHHRALEISTHLHALGYQGPRASGSGRLSPKRLLRALTLRAGKPLITHTNERYRELAHGLDESVRIALRTAESRSAAVEALALAQDRRIESALTALASRLQETRSTTTAQATDVARALHDLQEQVADLQDVADEARGPLDAAAIAQEALAATPLVDGAPFVMRDDPVAGRVLGLAPDHDPAGAPGPGPGGLFRGDEALVRESLQPYMAVLGDRAPVVDLGCGRGELLDLLAERGTPGLGVERDPESVAHCRAKGHTVEQQDVVAWLQAVPAASLGALFSARLLERLEPGETVALLAAARAALAPDGLLIVESTNPHSLRALRLFWSDPANRHPLFPEAMLALVRAAGFDDAYAFVAGGGGDYETDRPYEGAYAVVARISSAR